MNGIRQSGLKYWPGTGSRAGATCSKVSFDCHWVAKPAAQVKAVTLCGPQVHGADYVTQFAPDVWRLLMMYAGPNRAVCIVQDLGCHGADYVSPKRT